MLALLERVAADSFAELGGALLALVRGDSARAAAALRHAADHPLARVSGRPDILLLAGRVGARLGPVEQQAALAVFAEAVRTDGSGAAAPPPGPGGACPRERRLQPADAIQHLDALSLD